MSSIPHSLDGSTSNISRPSSETNSFGTFSGETLPSPATINQNPSVSCLHNRPQPSEAPPVAVNRTMEEGVKIGIGDVVVGGLITGVVGAFVGGIIGGLAGGLAVMAKGALSACGFKTAAALLPSSARDVAEAGAKVGFFVCAGPGALVGAVYGIATVLAFCPFAGLEELYKTVDDQYVKSEFCKDRALKRINESPTLEAAVKEMDSRVLARSGIQRALTNKPLCKASTGNAIDSGKLKKFIEDTPLENMKILSGPVIKALTDINDREFVGLLEKPECQKKIFALLAGETPRGGKNDRKAFLKSKLPLLIEMNPCAALNSLKKEELEDEGVNDSIKKALNIQTLLPGGSSGEKDFTHDERIQGVVYVLAVRP